MLQGGRAEAEVRPPLRHRRAPAAVHFLVTLVAHEATSSWGILKTTLTSMFPGLGTQLKGKENGANPGHAEEGQVREALWRR